MKERKNKADEKLRKKERNTMKAVAFTCRRGTLQLGASAAVASFLACLSSACILHLK
jgi:hypothetical protein